MLHPQLHIRFSAGDITAKFLHILIKKKLKQKRHLFFVFRNKLLIEFLMKYKHEASVFKTEDDYFSKQISRSHWSNFEKTGFILYPPQKLKSVQKFSILYPTVRRGKDRSVVVLVLFLN